MDDLKYIQKGQGQSQTIVLLHGYGANAQDLSVIADFFKDLRFQWFFLQAPFEFEIGWGMKGCAWFELTQEYFDQAQNRENFPELSQKQKDQFEISLNGIQNFFETKQLEFENVH